MAPLFVFCLQCALSLRHIQRKYLRLKRSEGSGGIIHIGVMKTDWIYFFCLFLYKEQPNTPLHLQQSWGKKKLHRRVGEHLCVCL